MKTSNDTKTIYDQEVKYHRSRQEAKRRSESYRREARLWRRVGALALTSTVLFVGARELANSHDPDSHEPFGSNRNEVVQIFVEPGDGLDRIAHRVLKPGVNILPLVDYWVAERLADGSKDPAMVEANSVITVEIPPEFQAGLKSQSELSQEHIDIVKTPESKGN